SKEHQGGGYNELLFDDTPGEVRAKLSSEPGKTQLNQGYLAHPRSNGKAQPRGDGFELRTDNHGAIRAAHGLLL
ncbi:type VI secretion system Vgr family protein, partial [Chromobacterium vaccinii]